MDSSPLQTSPNHVSSINTSTRRPCSIKLSHKRQVKTHNFHHPHGSRFRLSKFHHPTSLGTMCRAIKDLGVEGGIIARAVGMNRSTKLVIYVSAKMEKAFFCREALITLGAIHANFPEIPASWPQDLTASVESSEPPTCHCPRRGQEPLPIPTSLPPDLSTTDENVPALKQWLLDYYGSTTFNVCENQPLPMMKCEPPQLYVKTWMLNHYSPQICLSPHSLQEKALKDLERDVPIGARQWSSPQRLMELQEG